MPGFIENPLETAVCVLQAALDCARTHVKSLGYRIDRRTISYQPILNRSADEFHKRVFGLELPQLLLELWSKQFEQF